MSYSVLTKKELISLKLRRMYNENGFMLIHMPSFEEYDFYADKKEFLTSQEILTFTDRDGRLKALRPDVTLSLIKHLSPGKYHYSENVYRVSENEKCFREVPQSGIEIIGNITDNDLMNVIILAVSSLQAISDGRNFILSVADAKHIAEIIHGLDEHKFLECLSRKNIHGLKALNAPDELITLAGLSGDVNDALCHLRGNTAMILRGLEEYYGHMRVDFSSADNVKYYSGIVFKGYIEGMPRAVLSGGEYNIMGASGAGFCVYLGSVCDD